MHVCKRDEVDAVCAQAPKLIHDVIANYSDYGRKHRISGVVSLRFTVLPDGTVRDIVVTRSLEKSLDAEAVRSVRQWRFEPGTYKGNPVAVTLESEVSFRLR
ncbi:MAG TPA: energy transducer TonB [Candidatus Koribacter sp.]|jgi:protein TonB